MGLIAKDDSEERERRMVPEDTHHGVCIGVIELGTIYNERYDKNIREVLITWELPHERIVINDEGQEMPMVISTTCTISLHEKAKLRKLLESWTGKTLSFEEVKNGIDLKDFLNRNGMVQVVHRTSDATGKTYANVNAVLPLIKGLDSLTPQHAPVFFTFDDLKTEDDLPDDLPEWITNRIKESFEWQNFMNPVDAPF